MAAKRVKPRSVRDHAGETLLHVYWTHLPAGSNASAHLVMTNKVSSDICQETSPDFTSDEMQKIMFYARQGVRKVLLERRRAKDHG
jgi:hypothetical protein